MAIMCLQMRVIALHLAFQEVDTHLKVGQPAVLGLALLAVQPHQDHRKATFMQYGMTAVLI